MEITHSVRLEPRDYTLAAFVDELVRLLASGALPPDAHLIFAGSTGGADEGGRLPSGIRYLSVSWKDEVRVSTPVPAERSE